MKKSNILLLIDNHKNYLSPGFAAVSFPLINNIVNFYLEKSVILSGVSSESPLFIVFVKWLLVIGLLLLINQIFYCGIDYVVHKESREISPFPSLLFLSLLCLSPLIIDVFGLSIIKAITAMVLKISLFLLKLARKLTLIKLS